MRLLTTALVMCAAGVAGPATAVAAQPGAIFTQNAGCTDNGTVTKFADKEDVYIKGSNLTPGAYYVNVTEPDGAPLGSSDPLTVTVGQDGSLACTQVYPLTNFADTTNSGNVYSVSISNLADGTGPKQKNFKVDDGGDPPSPVTVQKFYDADADGHHDALEPLIEGWEVEATNSADTFSDVTTWNVFLEAGAWTISERDAVETNWAASTAKSVEISVPVDSLVKFGNYCTVPSGGKTIGFWSNKNGQALIGAADLAALRALNLKHANGSDFNPLAKSDVKSFVLNATATNMANMLSAQLVAMTLNVRHGFVDGNAFVLGYGGTVNALMAAAEAALAANANTVTASDDRSGQETLKNYLDALNNSGSVVPSTPCAFSFAP